MRASLIPLDGGQPVDIVKDITVIGRKEFCDIRLNHASVSKVHLVVVRTDGVLLFRDLGSTNGTKVNGQRVIRGALLPNDKLSIAACKYRVQVLPDTDPEEAPREVETPASDGAPVAKVILAKDAEQQAAARANNDPDRQIDTDNGPRGDSPIDPETPFRPMPPAAEGENKSVPPLFID